MSAPFARLAARFSGVARPVSTARFKLGMTPLQDANELYAVNDGHVDVHDHEINFLGIQDLQRLIGGRGGMNLPRMFAHHFVKIAEREQKIRVIVHEQYLMLCAVSHVSNHSRAVSADKAACRTQ